MADWLSGLASDGLGISGIRTARATVSAAHREGASLQALAGGEAAVDPSQDRLVSATIAGIARRVGPPTQAAGLRADGFARLLAVVDLEAEASILQGRRAIRDAALLWVMRDGMLRRGEAAALRGRTRPSKRTTDPGGSLCGVPKPTKPARVRFCGSAPPP